MDNSWENLVPFIGDNKFGYNNLQDNIMTFNPDERREEIAGTDEFVKVTCGDKYGWSHISGRIIVPCIYDDVDPETGDNTFIFLKEGRFVDIFLSGKWGIANICDGHVIVEPVYDERVSAYGNVERFVLWKDGKFALADFCGQVIIDFIYDFIGDFCCSLAEARLDEKYGFIDKDGLVVVPLEYDAVYDFNEGIAEVMKDGLFGFVNTKGEVITDCIYTDAYYCIEGLARVENEDGYGFINAKGEEVIPCQFTYADDFQDGKAIVSIKDRPGFWYIDKNGQIISEK